MIKINQQKVWVFDNPGVYDRYTIVQEDGSVWGCNDAPYHPTYGIAGYGCCITTDLRWTSSVTEYLEEARSCPKWLGREVKELQALPEDVVSYIKQITSEV